MSFNDSKKSRERLIEELRALRKELKGLKNREEEIESLVPGLDAFREAIIMKASEGIAVAHNIPDPPYVRFTVWNERMARLTGYSMDRINEEGWDKLLFPDPAERERAAKRMAGMLSGDDLFNEEWTITDAGGTPRVIQVSTSLLSEEKGESHAMAFVRDVTEQRRIERELVAGRERLLNIFEHTPVAIWEEDFSEAKNYMVGLYREHGPGLLDYLGSHPEEVIEAEKRVKLIDINRTSVELFEATNKHELMDNTAGVFTESSYRDFQRAIPEIIHDISKLEIETEIKTLKGNTKYVTMRWSIPPEYRESFGKVIVSFIDITKRKQAQDRLRESEAKYRTLFENAPESIAIVDMDGRILDINGFMGVTREEAVGKKFGELGYLHPDHREDAGKILSEVLAGNDIGPYQVKIIGRDGHERWIENYASLLRFKGEPYAVQVISRDITESRMLEEQLFQAQKMEAVGRLAGGVAHDFNNQLVVIQAVAEMLEAGFSENDPRRERVAMILRAAEQSAALTRQLLAFSRKQVIEPTVLDLNGALEGLEKMLARIIGEDVILEMELDPAAGKIRIDPTQIEQVVLNLAVNARDAMPEGGKLIIESANAILDEEYAKAHLNVTPGEYVMLAVTDTGEGMDKETVSHIFEPFYTTKEKAKGTGLGLSTVYGIVKQTGGSIFVYSEPGQGTSMKIYFPRADEADHEKSAAEAPAVVEPGKETVLVVEDEQNVRLTMSMILAENGYSVLEAEDGESALEVFEKNPEDIDLLITDVVMPGMNGKELAKRLKEKNPDIKTLFVSGYTDNVIAHHGVLESGTNFLQKPFAIDVLLKKVREALE